MARVLKRIRGGSVNAAVDMDSSPCMKRQLEPPVGPVDVAHQSFKRTRVQALISCHPQSLFVPAHQPHALLNGVIPAKTRTSKRTRNDDNEMHQAPVISLFGQSSDSHMSKRVRRERKNESYRDVSAGTSPSAMDSRSSSRGHDTNTTLSSSSSSSFSSTSAYTNTNELLRSMHDARKARAQSQHHQRMPVHEMTAASGSASSSGASHSVGDRTGQTEADMKGSDSHVVRLKQEVEYYHQQQKQQQLYWQYNKERQQQQQRPD